MILFSSCASCLVSDYWFCHWHYFRSLFQRMSDLFLHWCALKCCLLHYFFLFHVLSLYLLLLWVMTNLITVTVILFDSNLLFVLFKVLLLFLLFHNFLNHIFKNKFHLHFFSLCWCLKHDYLNLFLLKIRILNFSIIVNFYLLLWCVSDFLYWWCYLNLLVGFRYEM